MRSKGLEEGFEGVGRGGDIGWGRGLWDWRCWLEIGEIHGPSFSWPVCLHSWMDSTSLGCKMISHRSQTNTFSDSREGEMEERSGDNGGEGLLFPN